ncbi:GNAT family N-acetyltransferase [Pseudomonas cannabina]|uniref:GCN5-related N-acetyltransferase n=1 Tax=Pseudomonas cannabina TaxID=86840 RepID=A0A0P9MF08_PSECA|nr:GNAT family N-acetyltransferase [Pseudomonas cannabina]KAA8702821.1 GNAT family N-acetyltransferase [Pseudomonas cannabina]KPW81864.1 GCN5-related N-acetyltransferase [Pseudomonas cannabina]RMN40335.1 GCN5-related N-acetyltransferase [Pseudomonas cannabina]SDR26107.1 Acetyltransferase (GNAT) domain-containing protein [Pseudomonas cannabina]
MDMLRPYTLADRDRCLDIFNTNVPRYFDPAEREQFASFLMAPLGHYFVVERDGEVVACGGYLVLSDPSVAELTWGMVSSDRHGSGLGRFLTEARLDVMRALPGVTRAYINTSQRVQGFYSNLGFAVVSVEADGHGCGIDSVRMELTFSQTRCLNEG